MRIPILRLGEILLTSLPPDVTDDDIQILQSHILHRLQETRARGVVLDITALDVVDSYMARILAETARMAGMMGGEVVISGMHPMVALTLIEMGRDLIDVPTALTLERGVDMLKRRLVFLQGDQPEEDADEAG